MSDYLFEISPLERSFREGDKVLVHTIFGEEEGVVTHVGETDGAGFPLAQVSLENGDTISISVARIHSLPRGAVV